MVDCFEVGASRLLGYPKNPEKTGFQIPSKRLKNRCSDRIRPHFLLGETFLINLNQVSAPELHGMTHSWRKRHFSRFPTSKIVIFSASNVFLRKNSLFSTSIIILHHLSNWIFYKFKISKKSIPKKPSFFKNVFSQIQFFLRKNDLFSTSIIIPSIFSWRHCNLTRMIRSSA